MLTTPQFLLRFYICSLDRINSLNFKKLNSVPSCFVVFNSNCSCRCFFLFSNFSTWKAENKGVEPRTLACRPSTELNFSTLQLISGCCSAQHAATLYPLVTKHLGVPADRMYMFFQAMLWSRIQIGSIFSSFVDADTYSQYGSGYTLVKMDKLESKGVRMKKKIHHS